VMPPSIFSSGIRNRMVKREWICQLNEHLQSLGYDKEARFMKEQCS
jgi:hypothetical protein